MKRLSDNYRQRLMTIATFSICLAAAVSYGRIGISVNPNRISYVRYEEIKLTVGLSNFTGNRLRFGDAENRRGHLTFTISHDEGRTQEQVDSSVVLDGLELKPGETKQIEIVANGMYKFQVGGEFVIYAQVGHDRLAADYRSDLSTIHVRDGIELWSRDMGIPVKDNDEPIPIRQVKLMQVREEENDIYCLRIEDDENVYAVLRIGEMIHGEIPQCRIDAVSNIHILVRIQSRLFLHRVYDYRGKRLQVRYYMMTGSKPELYRDADEGTITVVGGRPAILGEDYVLNKGGASPANAMPDTIRRRPSRLE